LSDEQLLAWARENGSNPTEEQVEVWNWFMCKRGWKDDGTSTLERRKRESGFESREDIETMFDYLDADEGRPIRPKPIG
jgi:gluconokinase